jgi:hypothetical protein
LTAWTHNLGEEFETRAVMHAALVLAPLVAVATASGQPIWLEAAIVSGSAFIVMEKRTSRRLVSRCMASRSPWVFSYSWPPFRRRRAFVGATAAMAGASRQGRQA